MSVTKLKKHKNVPTTGPTKRDTTITVENGN